MTSISEAFQKDYASALTEVPRVRLLTPADYGRWDAFVQACPQATFFHRAGWQPVIEQAFGHRTWFYYAERAGEIIGVLPLAEIKSRIFGHSLSSLPFCVYGGVATGCAQARRVLEEAAQALARNLRVDHLEYRNREQQHPDWPSKNLYVTFRKDILPDEEQNMLAIPKKQRAMVRKGIKAGLQSQLEDDIDGFFAAYSYSVHRLGTPVFSRKYFRLLKEVFGDDCELMTIRNQGRIVTGLMTFYFRDEVLPYYGGGTDEARAVAGNDFMYWELMRRSCEQGYKVFDFGRSKHGTGAFDFKKNWGFEPQALHYEYQLHDATEVPDHNPLNPKYKFFIDTWRKMPLGLANAIGPFIVRSLG